MELTEMRLERQPTSLNFNSICSGEKGGAIFVPWDSFWLMFMVERIRVRLEVGKMESEKQRATDNAVL